MAETNWKSNLGDWIPLRTRDGLPLRVGPGDSPTRPGGHGSNNTDTPRQINALGSGNVNEAGFLLPEGQVPAAAGSSSSQPQQSSLPFFNPGGNNSGGLFSFLNGQHDESSEKNIHAPYFVSELLPSENRNNTSNMNNNNNSERSLSTSSSVRNRSSKSPSVTAPFDLLEVQRQATSINRNFNSSTHQHSEQQQQWIAFAPISPEEVQVAVSTIVGLFPAHTLSRYSVERTLTSRFLNLGQKVTEPTVLALYFYTGSRENALHVLHRHERSCLYKGAYGDVKCAVSSAPSFSLACGILHPFSQNNLLRNNSNNNVENSISLQLAQQTGKGNVSVCRKLAIRQQLPLRVRLETMVKKFGWKVLYVVIIALVLWLFVL